jgi:hypothetical protein
MRIPYSFNPPRYPWLWITMVLPLVKDFSIVQFISYIDKPRALLNSRVREAADLRGKG